MKVSKRNSRNDFANLLDGIFSVDFPKLMNELPTSKHNPPVNIIELEDQFTIEVALPGVDKESIDVDVNDNLLTISKTENKIDGETTKDEVKYTRKEFSFNTFKRTFNLPETVDSNLISANNNNGILSIVLPKKEEAKAVKKSIVIS